MREFNEWAHTLAPTQEVEVRGVKESGASLAIQPGCQKVKVEDWGYGSVGEVLASDGSPGPT